MGEVTCVKCHEVRRVPTKYMHRYIEGNWKEKFICYKFKLRNILCKKPPTQDLQEKPPSPVQAKPLPLPVVVVAQEVERKREFKGKIKESNVLQFINSGSKIQIFKVTKEKKLQKKQQ